MGFTGDWYIDGRVLSVRPSVIILLTDFIACTDDISPSVKLVNGVVFVIISQGGRSPCHSLHKYIFVFFTWQHQIQWENKLKSLSSPLLQPKLGMRLSWRVMMVKNFPSPSITNLKQDIGNDLGYVWYDFFELI